MDTYENQPAEIRISFDPDQLLSEARLPAWDRLRNIVDSYEGDDAAETGRVVSRALRVQDLVRSHFFSELRLQAVRLGKAKGIDVTAVRGDDVWTSHQIDEDGDTWERLIWQGACDAIPAVAIYEMIKIANAQVGPLE
jgi:hypothetical protein